VSPGPAAAGKGAPGPGPAATAPVAEEPRPRRARGRLLLAGVAAAVVVTGGAIAAALLAGGSGGSPGPGDGTGGGGNAGASTGSYTASAPWRLQVGDHMRPNDSGCSITLTDSHGNQVLQHDSLYVVSVFQVQQTGSFAWRAPRGCLVAALAGSGAVELPFAIDQSGDGDTPAFAPPARVSVRAMDYHGDADCTFQLHDATDGRLLDFKTAKPGQDTVTLASSGSRTVYLGLSNCGVHVSAG